MEIAVKTVMTALAAVFALTTSVGAAAATTFTEGVNYFLVENIPHTAAPSGSIEVVEVFSYGCPACNEFQPVARQLRASLPASAKFRLVPAAFVAAEDWPMFQRAYCTAEVLGIADKTHDAMFDAIWKTGELSITDKVSGRLKNPLPSIEDAARFYEKHSTVKAADFVAAANSMSIGIKLKDADAFIRLYRVDKTPTFIVANKYRTDASAAGGYPQLVELVNLLVAKELKK